MSLCSQGLPWPPQRQQCQPPPKRNWIKPGGWRWCSAGTAARECRSGQQGTWVVGGKQTVYSGGSRAAYLGTHTSSLNRTNCPALLGLSTMELTLAFDLPKQDTPRLSWALHFVAFPNLVLGEILPNYWFLLWAMLGLEQNWVPSGVRNHIA